MGSNEIRVATVKATGKRYIVQRLTIGKTSADSRVHCWGELSSYKGLATVHEASKTFVADAVTVETTAKTVALLDALLAQHAEVKRAAGHTVVRTRGGNYRDLGTPAQQAAAIKTRNETVEFINYLTSMAPKIFK